MGFAKYATGQLLPDARPGDQAEPAAQHLAVLDGEGGPKCCCDRDQCPCRCKAVAPESQQP